MSFFKIQTWKDVLFHVLAMIGLSLLIGYLVLYVWLPSYTNHGQKIEVPSLENLTVEEAEDALNKLGLRLEIQDTTYKSNFKPGVINRQEPKPKSFVKENRRIYVTVNAMEVPKITIDDRMFANLKNTNLATVTSKIRQYGFEIGDTVYVPGKYPDYVLNTKFNGRSLSIGTKVPKGGKIDLEVSDGKSKENLLEEEIESVEE